MPPLFWHFFRVTLVITSHGFLPRMRTRLKRYSLKFFSDVAGSVSLMGSGSPERRMYSSWRFWQALPPFLPLPKRLRGQSAHLQTSPVSRS